MNVRGLNFEDALAQDRGGLFAAPPTQSAAEPAAPRLPSAAKSKRELLWEQKKLARQSKSIADPEPRHVSFAPPAQPSFDPSALPPPPFKDEFAFKPPSRPARDEFSAPPPPGVMLPPAAPVQPPRRSPEPVYAKFMDNGPPPLKGAVPVEFQAAERLAPPSRESYNRKPDPTFDSRQSLPQRSPLHHRESAAPPSGNVAKQQYLRELQEQMELRKQQEKAQKQRKINEQRQKLQEMDRYAPWGANARNYGPGGMPRRDDAGNLQKAPPAISNPYSSYAQGGPPPQFSSAQSQPNLLPQTMLEQPYQKPPLSPQVTYGGPPPPPGYPAPPQTNYTAPQPGYGPPPPHSVNNLAAMGNGILQQQQQAPPPPSYQSAGPMPGPQHTTFQPAMYAPQGGAGGGGYMPSGPAQEYGAAPPPPLPTSVEQVGGGGGGYVSRREPGRQKTPLGISGAAAMHGSSKYVTKVIDEGQEAKKRAQQAEYQDLLLQQIEERKRKKKQEEAERLAEEQRQEEKLERERQQLEAEFKREQDEKKRKKQSVDAFNQQQWGEHQVSSKNPKAAAKRREAELFAQQQREKEQMEFAQAQPPPPPMQPQALEFQPADLGPPSLQAAAPPPPRRPPSRPQISETMIIQNVSKQIRSNLDRELEMLRGEMNQKDSNFKREVEQLKVEANRAEEEKRRSQLELENLKRELQENKFRDIKYEHDLALALKKTQAGPQPQFTAKPTSEFLPPGVMPQPNLIPPTVKGGLYPAGHHHEMNQTGTLHTLKHESQLIPLQPGDQTLGAPIQPTAPPMVGAPSAPRIIANSSQIAPHSRKAELSLSLDNSSRNMPIPEIQARPRLGEDSFPSIPDVKEYRPGAGVGGAGAGGGTLDGFTVNSVNLQKMNEKNRDRLAGLSGNQSYKPSDPKDDLAKLDQLLFNILHTGEDAPARKEEAVNFEQQVRGMMPASQAGAARGVAVKNPDHSLRSLQAEDIMYKQQMEEVLSPQKQQMYKPVTPDTLNIDSFVMNDTTTLKLDNSRDDSLQGVNTMSLAGRRESARGAGASFLASIEEDPMEASLRGGAGRGGGGHHHHPYENN